MVQAVVFDLDYTLAVPSEDRTTILERATETVDGPPITRSEYLDVHASHLTRETREPIFAELLADRETDVDPATVARTYRDRLAATLEPLPGVESMLASLREEYATGLLTNGPTVAQRDKIETLGWESVFDATLVTGELPAGKPDPRAFEAIADALAVAPAEVVYVGDDVEADVIGATNAGMRVVQVLLEGGSEPDPRADATVDQSRLATDLPPTIATLAAESVH